MDPEEPRDLAAGPVHRVEHPMSLRVLRVHGRFLGSLERLPEVPQVCRQTSPAFSASLLCGDTNIGVIGLDLPRKHRVFLRFPEGLELPVPKACRLHRDSGLMGRLVEHGAIGEKGFHLPYLRRPKLGGA